jgi:hypothetical protein
MAVNIPPVALMTEMNGRLYENIAAFNRDWVAFMNRGLKDNLELPQQIAGCNTAEEICRVYGDWYQKSAEHYLDGIVEMANNSKSLIHDTVTAVQSLAAKSVPRAESHQC